MNEAPKDRREPRVPPPVHPGAGPGPSAPGFPHAAPSPSPLAVRRRALSLAVAVMGVVDLLSAMLSHPPERLMALQHLVPSLVRDSSRTFTLLAGLLLLVTAWGLRRGKRRAFVAAMFLCAVSVPVNLLKAMDFEEATVASLLMFALGVSADAFQVRSRELSFAMLRSRAAWAVLALFLYAAAGSWWLEWRYGEPISLTTVLADAAFQLFGVGSAAALPGRAAPVETHILRWYRRSVPLLGITMAVGLALASLKPARYRGRRRAQARRVERLLREHGSSSVAWFALAEDSDYFFGRNERAVIAYRFEADVLLAIGDPIGPQEELGPLLVEFAEFCRLHDWPFAFFQARPERLPLYESLGLRAVHIGEDPVLWTERFTLEGRAIGQVRRAAKRAARAGLRISHLAPGEDTATLAAMVPDLWSQLREVSEEWLRLRRGGEKGFCMSRFDPDHLGDAWLSIAWHPGDLRVEGFTSWVPIPARLGWALDLMRRRADAPPGTMDLLIVDSIEAARRRGDAMLSLSLSPLARVAGSPLEPPPETVATTADRARGFLVRHLSRFYDFQGLFRWKQRFDPSFEPRYLVHPGASSLPRIVLALMRAQSPGGWRSYLRRRAPRAAEVAEEVASSLGSRVELIREGIRVD